jgi:hypothetical protein
MGCLGKGEVRWRSFSLRAADPHVILSPKCECGPDLAVRILCKNVLLTSPSTNKLESLDMPLFVREGQIVEVYVV